VQNPSSSPSEATLDLSPSQLNSIKIEPLGSYQFPVEKDAVGNIDFDEDLSVQVFPAYQGTILKTFGELGARVQKDQPLYTIKSPDLIQAESNLIGAAATFELTNKELARVQGLGGIAEREKEQATQINKPPKALSKPHEMRSSSLARPMPKSIK
jgi:membrane fusion protein, heavy metal efflux system